MPATANVGDRYINRDDHINYIFESTGWVEHAEESELQSVTTADNDKVLKVVNGVWAKGNASGGSSGLFKINMTASGSTIILDKNISEIVDAWQNGMMPFVYYDTGESISPVMSLISIDPAHLDAMFACTVFPIRSSATTGTNLYLRILGDDITYDERMFQFYEPA